MLKNVFNIAFQKLREEEEFVDLTLVSEDGREFKVHQVVLATACDKFKERVNRMSQHCQSPTILLKETSTKTLQSFLDFIYLQEAHVDIKDSESFRRTAEWFGLKNELQWKRLLAFDENREEKRMTNKKDEYTQAAEVFVHKNEKKEKTKRKRGASQNLTESVIKETNQQPEEKAVDKKKMLRLKNPRRSNACYVNSVLQLFQKSGLTEFLFVDPRKPLCSALAKLYNGKEEVQAKKIRMLVARISGRKHFAEVRGRGTQEDASSFLESLEDILALELGSTGHRGELSYYRSFKNQPEGGCHRCNTTPPSRTESFLQLAVPIPASGLNHSLSSILAKFFAANTETGDIKCSTCCIHDGTGKKCTCSKFPSEDKMSLTKIPTTLFIQLLRYSSGSKVMTPVALEDEVNVNGTKYTIHGAIVHRGITVNIGHYVTYLKQDGSWFLQNDDKPTQKVGLKQIDNRQTYVLIAKKCEAEGQISGNKKWK